MEQQSMTRTNSQNKADAALLRAAAQALQRHKVMAMPTLVPNTPNGFNWGFYAHEETKLHIQVLDKKQPKYKIWLEERGQRCFLPDDHVRVPTGVVRAVKAQLTLDKQDEIEATWIEYAEQLGRVKMALRGTVVVMDVYPGKPEHFCRRMDLAEVLPNADFSQIRPDSIKYDRKTSAIAYDANAPENKWHLFRICDVVFRGNRLGEDRQHRLF
jgi:hypothetical protein